MNTCVRLLCVGVVVSSCALHADDTPTVTSTETNQTKVAVTVYNDGFGVVRDERSMTLPPGQIAVRFMDVASAVQAETVQIDPVTAGDQLAVLEQNYEYDLMSPDKLLEKYVGKQVTLIQRNDYASERVPVQATLISYNNNQPIYRIGDNIVVYRQREETILPAIPDNLVSRPTLVWLLENSYADPQTVVANYMTGGMRWNADYVAVLADDEQTCNLNGWVTINNNSGATYHQAQLKLVAGDVQRVQPERFGRGAEVMDMALAAPAAARKAFAEEAMFEYHMYTLQRPTTLKQNQQKQVALLEARDVKLTKTFRVVGMSYLFRNQQGTTLRDIKVGVFVAFSNTVANSLGMPLPKGIVRVQKADSSGNNQFIGEDRIDHTPKDEEIELKLGDAFDVVAERTQTDYRKLGDRHYETAWKVEVRNHKDEDIQVELVEPLAGDWTVLESSQPYEKRDARTIVFNVPVPANGSTACTYRVRVRW
jgi:hypothetical protein